jgi:hypothetical protein
MLEWSGASQKSNWSSVLVWDLLFDRCWGFRRVFFWMCFFRRYNCKCFGTALFVSQELLWKEQRITPKFSFHTTQYAQYRPNVLGSSLAEQMLKDYNGQTYWLSVNLHSFYKGSKSLNGLIWLLVMEQTEC